MDAWLSQFHLATAAPSWRSQLLFAIICKCSFGIGLVQYTVYTWKSPWLHHDGKGKDTNFHPRAMGLLSAHPNSGRIVQVWCRNKKGGFLMSDCQRSDVSQRHSLHSKWSHLWWKNSCLHGSSTSGKNEKMAPKEQHISSHCSSYGYIQTRTPPIPHLQRKADKSETTPFLCKDGRKKAGWCTDVFAIVFLISTFNCLAQPVLRFRLLRPVSGASGNCRIHCQRRQSSISFLGRRCPRIFGPICRWLGRKNAHLANHDCRWKGEIGRCLSSESKKEAWGVSWDTHPTPWTIWKP